jgi:crystallin, alpha B
MTMLPLFMHCQRHQPHHRVIERNIITPEDLLTILLPHHTHKTLKKDREVEAINEDKNKFQVNIDVQHFAPEEISVKTVDGFLIIEAKHEEKEDDHGFISRSFTRRYALPEGVDADSVTSKLSSDGVLVVFAPLKAQEHERMVPIIPTGPVKKTLRAEE